MASGQFLTLQLSALYAVQQLSFGSTKIRHNGPIDDILIANNIASSADGLETESYGYKWTWKDEATKQHEKPSTVRFWMFNVCY